MVCKTKSSVCVLIVASFIALSVMLQSCSLIKINIPGTDEPKTTDTSPVSDKTTPVETPTDFDKKIAAFLAELPEDSYNGEDFIVMSSLGKGCLFDDGTTVYSRAVADRNETVKKKYGVKLFEITVEPDMMIDEVASAYATSSYYADLLLVPSDMVGMYSAKGLLMNLRSVPFLDLSSEYFYESSVSASTYGTFTNAVAGPASLDRDSLSCIYVNKYRADQLELGDLYSEVKNGTWTWERFFEIMARFDDYNAARAEKGYVTISTYSAYPFAESIADLVFHSSNETYLSKDGERLAVSESLRQGSSLLEVAKNLLSVGYRYDGEDFIDRFNGGTLAFVFGTLDMTKELSDSPYDWGILPVPSENGSFGTYFAPEKAALFAIPRNTLHSEKSGAVLSALNAASYGVLDAAYVRHAVNYLIRDNDSANMMDKIISSVVYDSAAQLEMAYPAVNSGTYRISYYYSIGQYISDWEWNSRISAAAEELARLAE